MPKNYDLKDFQGQYTGLNRVVMEVENIMRNQADPDLLDMKPFYDLYKRLQHEEFKSISQDPQTTGYKMGITSGGITLTHFLYMK